MKPMVSIIVPCYNCENYINETLERLVKQTYTELEIICVNDGSTDNSLLILNSWRDKSSGKVTIINQENQGVSAARNLGIQESHGEFIMFCDADDLFHDRMVETMIEAIEQKGTDTAYCLLSRTREKVDNNSVEHVEITVKNQYDALKDLLFRMGEICFCCFIYRTEIIKKQSIAFDIHTKNFEDREFNWKYLANCCTAAFVNTRLYWYRPTSNSATTRKTTEWRIDRLEAAQRVEEYIKEHNSAFFHDYSSHLYARVIWSVAKNYSLARRYKYLLRLEEESHLSKYMHITMHDKNRKVSLLSKLYLISPRLFYYGVIIGNAFQGG